MKRTYDILVEGAGPAGATFARYAAKRGYEVALFDHSFGNPPRLKTTRRKICAGYVHHSTIEKQKIPERAKSTFGEEYQVLDTILKGFNVISPSGEVLELRYPRPMNAIVSRRNFDYYLLEQALQDENIKFIPTKVVKAGESKHEVEFKTNKGRFKGSFCVGAGGMFSNVRKYLFWDVDPNSQSHCYQTYMYFEEKRIKSEFDDVAYILFLPCLGIGYAWSFPLRDCVAVGLGQESRNKETRECYDVLLNHKEIRDKLKSPTKIGPAFPVGALVPSPQSPRFLKEHSTSGERKVLLGDAALHVHPQTFEGIRYAINDGELAAECLARDGSFINFDRRWKELYANELLVPYQEILDFYDKTNLDSLIRESIEKSPELFINSFFRRSK